MATVLTRSKKNWTTEEKEELLELYGTVSISALMKKLNRSEEAIIQKHYELTGVKDMQVAGGHLSATEVAEAVGVTHRTVVNWIHNFDLPATQRRKKYGSEKRYRYSIDPTSFWRWATDHRHRIPFHLLKRHVILPEPRWVEKEVEKRKSTPLKANTAWTTQEDETAFFWWQSGMNYREIAKRLGRPEKGTQRRLTAIKKMKGATHAKAN